MFREASVGTMVYRVCEALAEIKGFVHAFTTRQTGALELDASSSGEVAPEGADFLRRLGISRDRLLRLRQVHSNRVVLFPSGTSRSSAPRADAVLLERPGCFSLVRTADCLPLIVVAPSLRKAVLIHAGWRGTSLHITRTAVERLLAAGLDPAEVVVAMGPGIRRCCYQVGEEVKERMRDAGFPLERLFGGDHLDLVEANRWDLEQLGVRRIHDSGVCTCCCPDLYYSYRRSRDRGRMWALAGFRPDRT